MIEGNAIESADTGSGDTRASDTVRAAAGCALDDARWAAVAQRSAEADGLFVYGVRSTGIYCRPVCGARRPLRRNVAFFATAAEAAAAGFRACRRCRPDQNRDADPVAAAVIAVCRRLEDCEAPVNLAESGPTDGLVAAPSAPGLQGSDRSDTLGVRPSTGGRPGAGGSAGGRRCHGGCIRRGLRIGSGVLRARCSPSGRLAGVVSPGFTRCSRALQRGRHRAGAPSSSLLPTPECARSASVPARRISWPS